MSLATGDDDDDDERYEADDMECVVDFQFHSSLVFFVLVGSVSDWCGLFGNARARLNKGTIPQMKKDVIMPVNMYNNNHL